MADERLRSIPLLAGFEDSDLERIGGAAVEVRLPAGDLLFSEGDRGCDAFVVAEGEVEVVKRSGGREVLVGVRKPGDVIGEMALLEEDERMASVRARSEAVLLQVPKPAFDEVLDTSTAAVRALFGVLSARWRETEVRLRQREQLAQLGTLSAGLAHELNNPAAAVKRAAAGFEAAAERVAAAGVALEGVADPAIARELVERLAGADEERLGSLERADREDHLIERLEALGVERPGAAFARLADLDGVVLDGVLDDLEDLPGAAGAVVAAAVARREVTSLAGMVMDGAGRISDIVGAVKSFAFIDRAPLQEVDLASTLDDTLVLLGHKLGDIEVVREYGDVPRFPAYGSELNQVWTNLIDNAADAIREAGREPGRLVVRSRVQEGDVVVEVEDDGPGIPPEVVPRVFDSFFTTKPPGSGTGLGLDISYGIVVHRHGGDIEIDTEPGRTVMRVRLPLAGPG